MNVTYFDPTQAHAAENPVAGIRIHWQYLRVGVAVFTLFLSVTYLVMLNGLATQGFDMETYKAEQLKLYQELEVVDITLAIPSSLYALESNELIQNLPLAEEKQFLEIKSDNFALINQ